MNQAPGPLLDLVRQNHSLADRHRLAETVPWAPTIPDIGANEPTGRQEPVGVFRADDAPVLIFPSAHVAADTIQAGPPTIKRAVGSRGTLNPEILGFLVRVAARQSAGNMHQYCLHGPASALVYAFKHVQ